MCIYIYIYIYIYIFVQEPKGDDHGPPQLKQNQRGMTISSPFGSVEVEEGHGHPPLVLLKLRWAMVIPHLVLVNIEVGHDHDHPPLVLLKLRWAMVIPQSVLVNIEVGHGHLLFVLLRLRRAMVTPFWFR